MKTILTLTLVLLTALTQAQDKYLTKTGALTFEASVPSFEEVKATNASTTAILNTENGEFAALVLIKGFRFKNALMEEHFNENYAESSKYPKATFKGTIKNYSLEMLKNPGQQDLLMDGELTFHGETKTIGNISLQVTYKENAIHLTGNFKVLVSDYNIDIPNIVSNKLSNEVLVSLDFSLQKQ